MPAAMDITALHPELLECCICIHAKVGDVLLFHSFITHDPSENLSNKAVF